MAETDPVMVPPLLPTQGGWLYSSAPISGVVAFRVSPSISVDISAIGVASAFSQEVAGARCWSVPETKEGSMETDAASCKEAACQEANDARAVPRNPIEPVEK